MLDANFHSDRAALGETNDCAVRALAAVSGLTYRDAHELVAAWGRQPRKGTHQCVALFLTLGATVVQAEPHRYYEATGSFNTPTSISKGPRTIRTLARHYKTGRYLVFIRGHVFALIDGQIVGDWATTERLHRIEAVLDASKVQA
jgi:hypothetical protein